MGLRRFNARPFNYGVMIIDMEKPKLSTQHNLRITQNNAAVNIDTTNFKRYR